MIVDRTQNGAYWGGYKRGHYIKWNCIYTGESAKVLDLLFKYGGCK